MFAVDEVFIIDFDSDKHMVVQPDSTRHLLEKKRITRHANFPRIQPNFSPLIHWSSTGEAAISKS